MKTVIKTELGALPHGEEDSNQLVIESMCREHPKDMDDKASAERMANWLFRYIPHTLYAEIQRAMERR